MEAHCGADRTHAGPAMILAALLTVHELVQSKGGRRFPYYTTASAKPSGAILTTTSIKRGILKK